MNALELIESYVHDVARRLPRKQRNDVAFELRALLQEELQAKADSGGRAPEAAMATELGSESVRVLSGWLGSEQHSDRLYRLGGSEWSCSDWLPGATRFRGFRPPADETGSPTSLGA